MRRLSRRVTVLLTKHPILWLPYLAADLLAICVWRLRGLAQMGIIHWFTTGHSALGGEIPSASDYYAPMRKALAAYLPIGIVSVVAVVCLFVAALVATSAMVKSVQRGQRPDVREILAILASNWRKITLFAVAFLLAVALFTGGIIALFYYLLWLTHHRYLSAPSWLMPFGLIVGVGCPAWLLMPSTMRLLGGAGISASATARNRATVLTVLVAEAGVAFGLLLSHLESSIQLDSQIEVVALSVLNSLAANSPDVLLFVVLACLQPGNHVEAKPKETPEFMRYCPS